MKDAATTLPGALQRAAVRHARRGIEILDPRGRSAGRRDYATLLRSVQAAAGRLVEAGVAPGDRVLVCLPTSWSWMETWLGASWIGALPAAVAPAGLMGSSEAHTEKVRGMLGQVGARLLVTGRPLRDELGRGGDAGGTPVLTAEEFGDLPGRPVAEATPAAPEDVGFLQFTSGSTGRPRAVRISHGAALHNAGAIDEAIGGPHGGPVSGWADSLVAWLPMHHDMGLIGCLFLGLAAGLELVLLNPSAFLIRPRLWLDRISRGGRTLSHAPNFGYQLCVERVGPGELEGLDLSGWRSAINGAEMVRPETTEAFAERLGGCGFAREAFRPCYGLAEATLAVTVDLQGKGVRTLPSPEGGEEVSLGRPVRDTEVSVRSPEGSALGEGRIGEVWVRGPGVFAGYHGDGQATAEALRDGWLRSGDLGFLHGGELALTGRLKDLLILRGENVMPHELEWIAEAVVCGGGASRAGAFSVPRGADGEQAVLVVETDERDPERLDEWDTEIRRRVGRALSLPLSDLVFTRRGRIPKTTSGKVQRGRLRQDYIDGVLGRAREEQTP